MSSTGAPLRAAARTTLAVSVLAAVPVLAAVACGGEPEGAGRPRAAEPAGYRVSAPGRLLARFPTDPADVRAESFFESAFAMAVDDSSIVVLDAMAARAVLLDLGARPRSVLGRRGRGPGELTSPVSVAIGPEGDVWVSEPGAVRLSRFRPDGAFAATRPTPYPAPNFAFLPDGGVTIPTMSANSLLARLDDGGRAVPLAIEATEVPESLGRGPMDRVALRALVMSPWAPDTLLVFRNRHGTDFAAWLAALSPRGDSVLSVRSLPLPGWLYTLIDEELERVREQLPPDLARGDFFVPFKSVRNVGGTIWLAPAPSARVIALSLARTPGDTVAVVVPGDDETVGMLDAAVVRDRLVALYADEVRVYGLERVEAERFTPPG